MLPGSGGSSTSHPVSLARSVNRVFGTLEFASILLLQSLIRGDSRQFNPEVAESVVTGSGSLS